jgi:hypothetical protein
LAAVALAVVATACGGGDPPVGLLVFTQVPAQDVSSVGSDAHQFPVGSRIVTLDSQDPSATLNILTANFHSARAPAVSPDGRTVAFSGQRDEGDPWEIWAIDIDGTRARRIVRAAGADSRYTDPAFLPGGRVVFVGEGSALHVASADGSTVTRITHHPGPDLSPTVLADGRVLFASGQPSTPVPRIFTARADGTAAQLFYQNRPDSQLFGRARERPGGELVFIESGAVVSVSPGRPLASRTVLSEGLDGTFHSVFPLGPDNYVVSYRPADRSRFGLHTLDADMVGLEPLPDADSKYHSLEPVVVGSRLAPKTFESVVDPQKDYGELYCLDADHSSLPAAGADGSAAVRVHTPAGLLGDVPLEADGSFYIQVPADTPLQFETLDTEGRVVRGPSAWVWLRPGERRGCIGCHEDRQLAPENRVPDAVRNPPVVLLPVPDSTTMIAGSEPGGRLARRQTP